MNDVWQHWYAVSVQIYLFFMLFDVINIKIFMLNIKRTHFIRINI